MEYVILLSMTMGTPRSCSGLPATLSTHASLWRREGAPL